MLFDTPLPARLDALNDAIRQAAISEDTTESAFMATLRRLKTEAHFLIALATLAGTMETADTVRRLSDLADAATASAIDFLLRDADRQGKLSLPDASRPGEGSGWIVLGMGKLGAHELNFSSDIDLIVFFDPEAPAISSVRRGGAFARRRVTGAHPQDRTSNYVFRTDLRRARRSTPLAIPVSGADYYEPRQNWERAAMIKARRRGHYGPAMRSSRTALCRLNTWFRGDRRRPFHQAPDHAHKEFGRSRSGATT